MASATAIGKSFMRGAKEAAAKLRKVADQFPDRVAKALYEEAQIEMTEAKKRTPVAIPSWYIAQGYGKYRGVPGALRASGRVAEPVRGPGRKISVTLSFGGASAGYAIYVHEVPDLQHPVGQDHYLSSVLDESRPHMLGRIAERVRLDKERE